ncbi:hypothetical protein [Crateriforma spongiae]|uniref:hypothetical protein n=1 Tax=Crateriforma spongiae TaxID=2724528 RepID=UPI0014465C0F|nr:hypothetical protein [Crateriforma spongiae]
MGGVPVLLLVAALGMDSGWCSDENGDTQYIIQVEPDKWDDVRRAGEITSTLPAELHGRVTKVVIRVGDDPLPRDTPEVVVRKPAGGFGVVCEGPVIPTVVDCDDLDAMPAPTISDNAFGTGNRQSENLSKASGQTDHLASSDSAESSDHPTTRVMKPDPQFGGFNFPGTSANSQANNANTAADPRSGVVPPPSPSRAATAQPRAGGPSTAPSTGPNNYWLPDGTTPRNNPTSSGPSQPSTQPSNGFNTTGYPGTGGPETTQQVSNTTPVLPPAPSTTSTGPGTGAASPTGSASSFGQVPDNLNINGYRNTAANSSADAYTYRSTEPYLGPKPPSSQTGYGAGSNPNSNPPGTGAPGTTATEAPNPYRTDTISATWNRMNPTDIQWNMNHGWTPETFEKFRLQGGHLYKNALPVNPQGYPINAQYQAVSNQQVALEYVTPRLASAGNATPATGVSTGAPSSTGAPAGRVPSYDNPLFAQGGNASRPGTNANGGSPTDILPPPVFPGSDPAKDRYQSSDPYATTTDPRRRSGDPRDADGRYADSRYARDRDYPTDRFGDDADPRYADSRSRGLDPRDGDPRLDDRYRDSRFSDSRYSDDRRIPRRDNSDSISDSYRGDRYAQLDRGDSRFDADASYRDRLSSSRNDAGTGLARDRPTANDSALPPRVAAGQSPSPSDRTSNVQPSKVEEVDPRAKKLIAAQPFFTTFLLLSIVGNVYLVFWLKGLRQQFREMVIAKRSTGAGLPSD